MSEIRNLTRNGETFYPLTCTDAVVDRDGNPVEIINDIFDISEYNESGTPPVLAKYASLDLALAAVPETKRKGGMTIRYVQTSDNNYVQYRYMSSSTAVADFTNVANWQGVDDEVILESGNLINGGALALANFDLEGKAVYKKVFAPSYILPSNSKTVLPLKSGKSYLFTLQNNSEIDVLALYKLIGDTTTYLQNLTRGTEVTITPNEDWDGFALYYSTTILYPVLVEIKIEGTSIKDEIANIQNHLAIISEDLTESSVPNFKFFLNANEQENNLTGVLGIYPLRDFSTDVKDYYVKNLGYRQSDKSQSIIVVSDNNDTVIEQKLFTFTDDDKIKIVDCAGFRFVLDVQKLPNNSGAYISYNLLINKCVPYTEVLAQQNREVLGFSTTLTKNISDSSVQSIGKVDIKAGDFLKIKCGGTFSADEFIIGTDANLTHKFIVDSSYSPGKEYVCYSSVDVTELFIWMRTNISYGTLSVQITNGLTERADAIEDILGVENIKVDFSSSNYEDFVLNHAPGGKIDEVSHDFRFNSIVIPLIYGYNYKIRNSVHAYTSPKKPEIGMYLSEFTEILNTSDFLVDDVDERYLLITVSSDLQTSVSFRKTGYIDLTPVGKIGIALGDSNMQASGITVNDGQDPASVMSKITGSTILNGGIGGTCFAGTSGLTFSEVCDAINSRDFTQVDSDIENIITSQPTWDFLRTRWGNIESTPITDVSFVLIAYGTNDWTASHTIDNPSDKFDKTTILGGLRYGVSKLLEANPKLNLYVFTPAYRYDLGGSTDNDSDNYQINGKYLYEIGDAIYDCCKELHIPCLNFYYTSGVNKFNRSTILYGGTHRTVYGYELMAKQYAKFVLSY